MMTQGVQQLRDRLNAAAARVERNLAFMEVCGTHTVSGFKTGLHVMLPANVKLLSGPGCPVCVTAQGDIDLMVDVALDAKVTLFTYGDMLKVPGTHGNLELARSRGANVKVLYSTLDAVNYAQANPSEQVVLGAVGFETTTPATAVAILEAAKRGLPNFTVLASHKVLLPALRALLGEVRSQKSEDRRTAGGSEILDLKSKIKNQKSKIHVDGFLCPGHASIILGANVFREIVSDYRMPCVVAGFDAKQMLAGMSRLTEMVADGKPELDNVYPQVVKPEGNRIAQTIIEQVFEPAPAKWRALGEIPASGLKIRGQYANFDAVQRFGLVAGDAPEPAGCRCGEVITGRCTPADCGLFGRRCTPLNPVGPCMVSSEGSCAAWLKYGRFVVAAEAALGSDKCVGTGNGPYGPTTSSSGGMA